MEASPPAEVREAGLDCGLDPGREEAGEVEAEEVLEMWEMVVRAIEKYFRRKTLQKKYILDARERDPR